jgi:hypothetical protein
LGRGELVGGQASGIKQSGVLRGALRRLHTDLPVVRQALCELLGD